LRINSLEKTRENSCPRVIAGNLSTKFFLPSQNFWPGSDGHEKALLHTNGAKRRRVLKGEKLAVRGRGISTYLSTFVLKT
jgi:hypothetical protein